MLTQAREAASDLRTKADEHARRVVREAQEAARELAGLDPARGGGEDPRGGGRRTRAPREILGEARSLRERMLTDLNERRTDLEQQIGELRANRGKLVEVYELVGARAGASDTHDRAGASTTGTERCAAHDGRRRTRARPRVRKAVHLLWAIANTHRHAIGRWAGERRRHSKEAARAAQRGGAAWLAVATAVEAAELRAAGIDGRLLVLGALAPDELRIALEADADIVVWREAFVAGLPGLPPACTSSSTPGWGGSGRAIRPRRSGSPPLRARGWRV